jgi:hypothetical protein
MFCSPPGSTWTSWTVAPRRSSLPTERVKPSSARCAVCARGDSQDSGGRPSTSTRPLGRTLRMVGWKKA